MNQSTNNTNYDQDLAIALGLPDITIDCESDFNADKKIKTIVSFVSNLVKEFQADMIELSHKFRSASAKIGALIFMPENLLSKQNDIDSKLQFSAILIEQPDIALSFAPSPVSLINNNEETKEREEQQETARRLKTELKQQLLWFQEFGIDGLIKISAATSADLAQATGQITGLVADLVTDQACNQTTGHTEKTKRHLTLIADHIQAA
ncbi:hypothetical protein KBI23_25580 [bacterium]|nr:hypothetical protein [bacterium]MBP9811539.1 hypothetical protein [bacterium]